MLRTGPKQLSLYSLLYDNIPENHILKTINKAIDLKFVNKLLEGSYSKYYGRPAKEPEMMLRIQILKYLYNLSDEQLIQDLSVNLAYKWFVGLNPEDPLPEISLLTKFRTQRLKDISMDAIITEIVRQCVERGIINSNNGIAIDTTHIEANTVKKVPERIMKHLARNIFKAMGQEEYEIPDYTQIEDHNEAKQVMKGYLENLIEQASNESSKEIVQAVQAVQEAQEILESDLFIEQKGIRSLIDKDARVGYKSKTQSFYGYKAEICQTTDGSLITSVTVEPGSYVDGSKFKDHLDSIVQSGLNLTSVYGDKAYFRADILNMIKEKEALSYIPVSASAYKIDEKLFSYNKDSDQWFCVMGNETAPAKAKTFTQNGKKMKLLEYSFERERCRNCPQRAECVGKSKGIARLLRVGVNAPEFFEYSQRAKGYGLQSVRVQAKLTVLAVNLKRIAKMVSALKDLFTLILRFLDRLLINKQIRIKPAGKVV